MPFRGIEPLPDRPNFLVMMIALGPPMGVLLQKENLPIVSSLSIPGESNVVFHHEEPAGFGAWNVPQHIEDWGYRLSSPYLVWGGSFPRFLILPWLRVPDPLPRTFPRAPYSNVFGQGFTKASLWTATNEDFVTLYGIFGGVSESQTPRYILSIVDNWRIA